MNLLDVIIFLTLTRGIHTTFEGNFWIEPLTNSSGLYQERLGTIHLTTNSWRVDIKINLSEFKNDVNALMKSINTTRNQCSSIGSTAVMGCEMVSRELIKREHILQHKINELYLIMHPQTRYRRDLLDKVGRVGNVLFGLMDSEDSQKIYKALDNLNEDSSAIHEDLAQHRTVVNSLVRAFNETSLELNDNFRRVKKAMSDLGQVVDANTKEIQLTEINTILFSHVYQLDQKIIDLLDIVQKAHDGTISGKLFRLPSFSEALSRLHRATLQDVRLPFDLEKLHLRQLNAVADIEGHYVEDGIVLSLTIPLTENMFALYKVTSIPIQVDATTYALIDNPYPFVATSESHGDVMLLTKDLLEKCNAIDKTNFVCKHSLSTYTDKSRNCVRRLMTGQVDHSVCDVRAFKSSGELWEPLAADNKWLFIIPKPTQIQISCPRERTTKTVRGVGILHLEPLCRAYTAEVQLITVLRAVELSAGTITLDTKVLENFNYSGLADVDFEGKGLGHIDLQEVGTKVPLLPIANSTYQQKHTKDTLYNQSVKIRFYESLLLGVAIGFTVMLVIYILFKNRLALWRLIFLRNKTSQTEPSETNMLKSTEAGLAESMQPLTQVKEENV